MCFHRRRQQLALFLVLSSTPALNDGPRPPSLPTTNLRMRDPLSVAVSVCAKLPISRYPSSPPPVPTDNAAPLQPFLKPNHVCAKFCLLPASLKRHKVLQVSSKFPGAVCLWLVPFSASDPLLLPLLPSLPTALCLSGQTVPRCALLCYGRASVWAFTCTSLCSSSPAFALLLPACFSSPLLDVCR